MIIAADLLDLQVKLLLDVLPKYIKAVGWTNVGTVGIPLGIFTHKI